MKTQAERGETSKRVCEVRGFKRVPDVRIAKN
jgi:hypothetical protein